MSTITITNNFNAPIGQHIDHVDKIEAHFDKDMGMQIEMCEQAPIASSEKNKTEMFKYISPFITKEEERVQIHKTIVNLVTSGFRLSAICGQLKELIKKEKITLYVSTTDQYNELVRMGLDANKDGYSQKNYENYMSEQKK